MCVYVVRSVSTLDSTYFYIKNQNLFVVSIMDRSKKLKLFNRIEFLLGLFFQYKNFSSGLGQS